MKPFLITLCFAIFLNIVFDFLSIPSILSSSLLYLTIVYVIFGLIYWIVKAHLLSYFLKRLIEAVFTVFVIASLTFLLLKALPGGPFDSEKVLPPEIQANLSKKYNLDASTWQQYQNYMLGLLKGDLGQSYKYIGRTVSDIIAESLPVTFKLGFYALLLAFLIGIPLGLLAATWQNTWLDRLAMITAISGIALPNFVLGSLLIVLFAIHWQILPLALWETPLHYILPVITLGVRPVSLIARLMRASVLEVIHADYIRTAWAKGLSAKMILFKHVLRNSLVPVLSISSSLVAGLLSGSFVVELIFAVPGMGKHLLQSVNNRDYPLILGLTLLYSVLLILANLIVDLLYGLVDPRIQLGKNKTV